MFQYFVAEDQIHALGSVGQVFARGAEHIWRIGAAFEHAGIFNVNAGHKTRDGDEAREVSAHTAAVHKHAALQAFARGIPEHGKAPFPPGAPDVRRLSANSGFFQVLWDHMRHAPYFTR